MTLYKFSHFQFNTETREFISPDSQQYLRKKVADVLQYLLENRLQVISKEQLLEANWAQAEYRENSLIQSIREIRKLLGESAQSPRFIRTVHMKGYEWIFQDVEIIAKPEIEKPNISSTSAIDEYQEQQQEIEPVLDEKRKNVFSTMQRLSVVLMLFIAVLAAFFLQPNQSANNELAIKQTTQSSVLVLPFDNNTGDDSLDWLELGYSDMFTNGLAAKINSQVIPPYVVQGVLAQQNMQQIHNDSQQIIALLDSLNAQYALVASVSKDQKLLRFNYRIYDKKEIIATGSVPFPELPSSISGLVSKVATNFNQSKVGNDETSIVFHSNIAQRDYAQALQALTGKGPLLAKNYLNAALINEPDNAFIHLKMAEVDYLLGHWQAATTSFSQLLQPPHAKTDVRLGAHLGLAKIYLHQIDLIKAKQHIEQAVTIAKKYHRNYLLADAYRLKAQSHYTNDQFAQRHMLLNKADAISRPYKSLSNEAEALYYLGSPTNVGPETDPFADLAENQNTLSKALDYYYVLDNKLGIANTLHAIGQNYLYDVEKRYDALTKAIAMYQEMGVVKPQIDALQYLGFFFIQYHYGQLAIAPIETSLQLAQQLNDKVGRERGQFLLGFAQLDHGINRGLQKRLIALQQAELTFKHLLNNDNFYNPITNADTLFMLGWALSEQGKHQEAIEQLEASMSIYNTLGREMSVVFAQYSLMEENSRLAQWQQVLALSNSELKSYLHGLYQARALFETKQLDLAIATYQQTKIRFGQQWTPEDEAKLNHALVSQDKGFTPMPFKIKSSHLTYCEDMWNIESIEVLEKLIKSHSSN